MRATGFIRVEMEEAIIQTLSVTNPFTQEQLKEGILSWPADLKTCVKRAALFKALSHEANAKPTADAELAKINELCETLEPLLRESTEVEKEGYSQVHFQGNPWSGINSLPFALTILSIYKSYIVPAFGIILPLMSIILPYFLLVIFYNIPITFGEYSGLLWRIWNGQGLPKTPEDFMNPPPPLQEDSLTQLKRMAQNGWTLFTVGQTLWQPIQQARHFIKLDTNCLELGESVLALKNTCSELVVSWKKFFPSWISTWLAECPSDSRQAFAFVLETPFWLRHTFRAMSRFELLYILGKRQDIVSTEFVNSEEPVLMIKDFGDSSIEIEKRVMSSIRLGGGKVKHSILTGPNRGGKSSFMRGILINILLSHAFGCAFAEKAQMTHFSWIANGLRLDDTPGKQSMFEREVSFSSSVLRKRGGRGIVLYDELFHSTNPPDAIRSSKIFCNSLWKKVNCLSVVSTHVYSLAESAPLPLVKPICVAAWHSEEEGFQFSYSVRKGICEVSSVDLVLRQYGMIF
jgi:hypothetical protein